MNKWVVRIIAGFLILIAIICALAFVLPDNTTTFGVEGPSMEPTLYNDSMVNTDKTISPSTNDIIVFKYKNTVYIKRLIYIKDNCYWVEGDNKENSEDSRSFGWLCRDDIELLGVVVE